MAGARPDARAVAEQMAEGYYIAHGYAEVPAEFREPFVSMLVPLVEMAIGDSAGNSARLDVHEVMLTGLLMRDAEARGELGADWPAALPSDGSGGDA